MGRSPCCSKVGLRRGPWSTKEDTLLASYIQQHGEGQWRSLPKKAGLVRCGKSCRLRWMNYLRPGIKRGNISEDEEDLIVRLHRLLGNRWALIAGRLPGRTDNEIKNYWNTHLHKKQQHTAPAPAPAPASVHKNKKKKSEAEKDLKSVGEEMKSSSKVIYSPKPIRVSSAFPRSESYDGGSSSSEATAEVAPLPELLDATVLHHFSDYISDDVDIWEKVYAECLQIL